MASTIKGIPISSLPEADLQTSDQIVAYREDNGKAYRSGIGSMSEANEANISDAFSTSKAYEAGDCCIYNDTLYRFLEDKDPGEWDADVVEKVTVTEMIKSNTDLIDSLDILSNIGETIPDGSDLNDYMTPGKYNTATATNTQTLTNCPAARGGISLYVAAHSGSIGARYQFITMSVNTSSAAVLYFRYSSPSGVWTNWQLVNTTDIT